MRPKIKVINTFYRSPQKKFEEYSEDEHERAEKDWDERDMRPFFFRMFLKLFYWFEQTSSQIKAYMYSKKKSIIWKLNKNCYAKLKY